MALPEIIESGNRSPLVETKTSPEIGQEIKEWVKPVPTADEIELPQPVTDDQGRVLVSSPAPQQVKLQLPLTSEEEERGLHLKVVDSLRWLAEWCLRLTKTIPGKFFYH